MYGGLYDAILPYRVNMASPLKICSTDHIQWHVHGMNIYLKFSLYNLYSKGKNCSSAEEPWGLPLLTVTLAFNCGRNLRPACTNTTQQDTRLTIMFCSSAYVYSTNTQKLTEHNFPYTATVLSCSCVWKLFFPYVWFPTFLLLPQ